MIHLLTTEEEDLKKAGELIQHRIPVIFPTETVYGIGANGLDPTAIQEIFRAKGRPADNPLILHIAEKGALHGLGQGVPSYVDLLVDQFWPGPLSLVVEAREHIPSIVRAGLPTVAIRMPDHPVARKIIAYGGGVVAAPSANVSGRPSPTTFSHAWRDAKDMEKIHGVKEMAVVDGGETMVGLESTVLLCTSYPPVILRPGKYTAEDIAALVGDCETYEPRTEEQPISPGMKYGHYMATKPTLLMDMTPSQTDAFLQSHVGDHLRVLFLAAEENQWNGAHKRQNLASYKDAVKAAEAYFKTLRQLDGEEGDLIVIQAWEEKGMGVALYERMKKSARGQVIKEGKDEDWIW